MPTTIAFENLSDAGTLAKRADMTVEALVDRSADWILVTDEAGAARTRLPQRRPGAEILVAGASSGLSRALLDSHTQLVALADRLAGAGTVELVFQVWSEDLEVVVDELEVRGVRFDAASRPRVSGATVDYWNTKRGGHELLSSIPGMESLVPEAFVCSDLVAAVRTMKAHGPSDDWVMKADRGHGGFGVILLPREEPRDVSAIAARTSRVSKAGKGGVDGLVSPRVLLQRLLGSPHENVSPTADFTIGRSIRFLGIGLQRLEGAVAYTGVESLEPMRLTANGAFRPGMTYARS